ncbi:MAG TPA: long-chain fatty acid--CoA ligase [Aldersonia sp.]
MTDTTRSDEVQRAASLCAVFQDSVRERPDTVALRSSDGALEITWREYGERVRRIAAGLAALGVRRGDTVAIMLTNRPEFHLVDVAVTHLGATPFSIYNTSSPEQMDHVFSTAGNRIVVCEEQFLERIHKIGEQLGIEHVVCVDGEAEASMSLDALEAAGDADFDFDATWRAVDRDDIATLIFTSGTTGAPKAVQLTHANILYTAATLVRYPEALGAGAHDARVLSYLPDAHMANRFFAHYLPLTTAATVVTVRDAKTVATVLRDVHPTMFVGVPMIWYRFKAAVEQVVTQEPGERKELLARALETGLAKVHHDTTGTPVPEELRARHAEAERLVLSPLRAQLGLDNIVAGISGGAPIAAEALEFLMALGIPILEGWAMSETAGAGILNPPDRIKPGTVGVPVAGTEVRIAEDGELLVRSAGVMKGYRNDPEKTAEAVDADGWLHTGDIVTIDADGYISIVDRKKELIINSAGKNMSPAHIENAVKTACSLIGSVMAVGDRRPYVSGLVTLDPDVAASFAAAHGLADASPESLSRDPQVQAAVQAGIEQANATLSRVEQIRSYTVLPTYWLPNGDELTPTMKLKRKIIGQKYAAEIEEIYARPDTRKAAVASA